MKTSAHKSKYKLDPVLPVTVVVLGIALVSVIFGMLLFPVLTQVCATEILYSAARMGYLGVGLIFVGLVLEAYHLYEMHRKHISVLVIVSIAVAIATSWMIYFLSNVYSC